MIGTTLSHFKITAKLGEGGCGGSRHGDRYQSRWELVTDIDVADGDAIFGVSVAVQASEKNLGRPERLFGVDMKVHSVRQFDTLDGERFLVKTDVNSGARTPPKLLLNWTEGL